MRKLAKGPAIAAAILSIFSLFSSIVTLVSYIQIGNVPAMNYITLALSFVTTVLLVVVLFRGKADIFAAVVCFIQIPGALLSVISAVYGAINAAHYGFSPRIANLYVAQYSVLALFHVLKIAVFALMAIRCLRKKTGKSIVCVILPIVAIVIMAIYSFLNIKVSYGSILSQRDLPPYLIGQIIGGFAGSILGVLPLIFTGMAFGKVRSEEGRQIPAQQYQANLYQQYQAPQQPQYQQAQYQNPYQQGQQYRQPQYQAPYQQAQYQYQQPQYQQPYQGQAQYQQPQYQGQQYQGYPKDPKNYGFISMATHVLLSLFTFGIWTYIWIYRTTRTLSTVPGEQPQNPTSKLLLCMFVPFYMIFWLYNQGKRAEIYGRCAGVQVECATMCLVFAFLFPLVSYILLQSGINKAAEAMAR